MKKYLVAILLIVLMSGCGRREINGKACYGESECFYLLRQQYTYIFPIPGYSELYMTMDSERNVFVVGYRFGSSTPERTLITTIQKCKIN